MADSLSNLEFQPGDADALRELCARARKRARNDPCYRQGDALDRKFSFRFGDWNISLTIDAFTKGGKFWHGSVAGLQEISLRPVQLPSGLIVQMPEEALIAAESWDSEQRKQAKFLLGELMGPLILAADTKVHEQQALFGLHWLSPFED